MTPKEIKAMPAAEIVKHLVEYNKWCRGIGKYRRACAIQPYYADDICLIIDRAIELLKEVK
jgi:hypothetical protein